MRQGTSALYSKYSFAVYGLATISSGANSIVVPPTKNLGHDLTAFLSLISNDTRLIFIANPNNPTGSFISKNEIESFLSLVDKSILVVLDEAYMSAMVSTYETPPTQPVVLTGIDLNVIDNMFIVSEPAEIKQAVQEQIEDKQGVDYLAFTDLDFDALEENILEDDKEADLEFTELDINFLDVDLLQDLLEIMEVTVDLATAGTGGGDEGFDGANIVGTAPGFDKDTSFNTIIDQGGGTIWFYRDNSGIISVKIPISSGARIDTEVDGKTGTIIVNGGGSINIIIRQQSG